MKLSWRSLARATRWLGMQSDPPGRGRNQSRISTEVSPDLAARVFYESIRQSGHAGFCKQLESYAADRVDPHQPTAAGGHCPGCFTENIRKSGADGSLAGRRLARKFGFEMLTSCRRRAPAVVSVNSAILARYLGGVSAKRIWLLSLSKGSSEVRHYLQNQPLNPAVVGWLNIAGIAKGHAICRRQVVKQRQVRLEPAALLPCAAHRFLGADRKCGPIIHSGQNEQWPRVDGNDPRRADSFEFAHPARSQGPLPGDA